MEIKCTAFICVSICVFMYARFIGIFENDINWTQSPSKKDEKTLQRNRADMFTAERADEVKS